MEAAILTLIVTNLLATVGFSLQIGNRFDQLNGRIDKLSDRVGGVEQRLVRLEGQLGVPNQ